MNSGLISIELGVGLLGLIVLMADLWIAPAHRRYLGWGAAAALTCLLVFGLGTLAPQSGTGFSGLYVVDPLARFFKAFFMLSGVVVLLMTVEYADRLAVGLSEFFALTLFAVTGMLFAASANDLTMMFVSLELITVTFYVLNSFQRGKLASIEAGVKYLILGALASAFMVFGIALIFGSANTTQFPELALRQRELSGSPIFLTGLAFVLAGLGFKIAAVPFHGWAPDVYQGSPAPATALLAVGSKAAGFVLLLRLLFGAVPQIATEWRGCLGGLAVLSLLYGSLGAIPQRSVKRLMGYSSIANAGFLLLGVAAVSPAGSIAVLYYLAAYCFTVLAVFTVLCVVMNGSDADDMADLAGLGVRSPVLAAVMTLALASLAGVPPLAGFIGKFLILRAVIAAGATHPGYYGLAAVAVIGAVISLYYYFGIVRMMYWGGESQERSGIAMTPGSGIALLVCVVGILYLGIAPHGLLQLSADAIAPLQPSGAAVVLSEHLGVVTPGGASR